MHLHIGKVFISSSLTKDILTRYRILVEQSFSFNILKLLNPYYLACKVSDSKVIITLILVPLYILCFPLSGCLHDFPFSFQLFEYDMPSFGVFFFKSFLTLLDLLKSSLVSCHLTIQIFLLLCSFFSRHLSILHYLLFPHSSWIFSLVLFSYFFSSLHFNLSNFYEPVFKFTDSFFSCFKSTKRICW